MYNQFFYLLLISRTSCLGIFKNYMIITLWPPGAAISIALLIFSCPWISEKSKPNSFWSWEKTGLIKNHIFIGWGKTADVAEKYLKKGSEIAIDGKLQYRSYEDNNGEKRYVTEIMINELVMLGKK